MKKLYSFIFSFLFAVCLFAQTTMVDEKKTLESLNNQTCILQGKSELHLTGTTPMVNSTIDLQSENAWVFIKEVKPSVVKSTYLSSIKINGQTFTDGGNGRVAIYAHGTVLIPHASTLKPLTVYTGEDFTGESMQCAVHTFYKNLGNFDNKIKSFKLKRGYMATFANNADGTGYSRVFTADEEDIEINMPTYLYETVSFIRVFKYQWVSKKGWGGSSTDAAYLNCTWHYNWSADGSTSSNIEFVPHKHKLHWPGWGMNDQQNITHALGVNEPDKSDQANATYEQVMDRIPEFFNSGLRITSPVTSDFYNGWNEAGFIKECDSRNYRQDVTTVHAYQQAGWWSASRMSDISSRTNNRPIWITEWNVGANWTNESWPSGTSRLATDANVEQHRKNIQTILDILDAHPKVERYAIYNWVQDCRAMLLTINDNWKNNNPDWENYQWLKTAEVAYQGTNYKIVYTPAGKIYRDRKAPIAYSKANEKVPEWNIPTLELSHTITTDNTLAVFRWKAYNDELIQGYVFERKLEGGTFQVLDTLKNYTTATYSTELTHKATYRVRVLSKMNTFGAYSNEIQTEKDFLQAPPQLTGEVVSTSIIKLQWNTVAGARYYNLKRSTTIDGNYETLLKNTTLLEYTDDNLSEDTNYYYKISSVNYAGEGNESVALMLKTKKMEIPEAISGFWSAAADSKITLNWDFMYDVKYKVQRAENENEPYQEIAADLDQPRYVDTDVENGKTYHYQVLAYNAKGDGPVSALAAKPLQGLHLYYDFNESSGDIAFDRWGGYDATFTSEAVKRANGRLGKAIELNATADSYIQLPEGIVSGLNNFTVAAWIHLNANEENTRIFDFGNGTNQYISLSPNAGSNTIRYKLVNGDTNNTFDVEHELSLKKWTHIALKRSGVFLYLYIDGNLIERSGPMALAPAALGNTVKNYIGKSQSSTDPVFNGRIDDFRIYNYALSDNDVMLVMKNEHNPDPETGIREHYAVQPTVDFYPIPLKDVLNICSNDNSILESVEFYSVSGQKILAADLNKTANANIQVNDLPRGLYVVKIKVDGKILSRQVVKE